MAYGRHQSFYVKSNWINKGIKAMDFDSSLFGSIDRYKDLGIGKNMFIALKYWLEALNVIEVDLQNTAHKLTSFGKYLRQHDLSCERNFTLNLLHYYLTLEYPINGYEKSHSFYYLFNLHESKSFSKEDLLIDIVNWDSSYSNRVTSEKTIGKDIDCLIQTYTKIERNHPEDLNVSILAKLGLIKKSKDYYNKVPLKSDKISKEVFFYVILRLMESHQTKFLDLDTIENFEMSPGKVFNLSRVDIIDVVEEMISEGFPLVISRTNNLDTLTINSNESSSDFIISCFKKGDLK